MNKTIVWCSISFLLGGIAAITYFTFFADNNAIQNKPVKNQVRYVTEAQAYNDYTMKQLDSLTAASNYKFTKMNAVDHSVPATNL